MPHAAAIRRGGLSVFVQERENAGLMILSDYTLNNESLTWPAGTSTSL
jgi:hypothetical protein